MPPLPDVNLQIQKNGLGSVPANAVDTCCKLGVSSGGTPNTLYSFGDKNTAVSTLLAGPLLEAICDTLDIAGGPVLAIPLNPSAAGVVGSTTQVGTGSGTVTGSAAPAQLVKAKIIVGGARGTATIAFSVNNGPYSNPVATAATMLVPGTLTALAVASQTYTAGDVWTFNVDGTSSIAGSGTLSWITQASSTLDNFDVLVTVSAAGALGAATFTWSVDGGKDTSGITLVPSGGVFVIPGTGVVLTFAGTFVAADTYEFKTSTAGFSNTDVTNALNAMLVNPAPLGFVHVVGMGTNSAAAASMAAVVDAAMTTAQTNFRFIWSLIECPDGESDTTIATAFENFTSERLGVAVGDILHVSGVSGNQIRRNAATVISSRFCSLPPSIDAGNDSNDELTAFDRVTDIFRDEFKTPFLDAQRFMTLRTEVGVTGFFLTNPNLMNTDDFSLAQNRRVMDVGCGIVRKVMIPFLNSRVQVNKRTGFISPLWASRVEKRANRILQAGLNVGSANADADDTSVVVTRNVNILSTRTVPVTVGIIPFGYAKFIYITIGFVNPALAS